MGRKEQPTDDMYCGTCGAPVDAYRDGTVVTHKENSGNFDICIGSRLPGVSRTDQALMIRTVRQPKRIVEKGVAEKDDRTAITLRLPSDLNDIVRAIALIDGVPANIIIEHAVRCYIDNLAEDKEFKEKVLEKFGPIIEALAKVHI